MLDKNLHWWNRYRASDGNDIWGGRSKLTFVNDQTNADVLQPELLMLDVMTANRDEVIWARTRTGLVRSAKGHPDHIVVLLEDLAEA